jgi:uncharacterized protein YcfL
MKTAKTVLVAAIAVAGIAGLSGCRNTSGTVVTTDHATGTSSIIEENGRLAHHVKVLKTTYDEVNGLKRVHVTLASNRNRRLRVDYRICWFDANGVELDPQTKTYRNLILEGRDAVTVSGVANSASAVSSKLRLRETSQAE